MFHHKWLNWWTAESQLWLWIGLLLAFLTVPNSQALVTMFIIATYLFFLFGSKLLPSLFLSLLLALPFKQLLIGVWLNVVTAQPALSLRGYAFSFGLHVAFILFMLITLLLFFSQPGRQLRLQAIFPRQTKYLLIFWLLAALSSLTAPRLDLALTGLASLSLSVGLYIVSVIFFRQSKLRTQFLYFIIGLVLLFGLVGVAQFWLRQSLGLYIENRSAFSSREFLTTDGETIFRVSGLMAHPTFFASSLSLLLPIVIGVAIDAYLRDKKSLWTIAMVATALGSLALFATFSRSGWLSFGLSLGVFGAMALRKKIISLQTLFHSSRVSLISAIWGAILILFLIFSDFTARLSSITSFFTWGNWTGRAQLISHSFTMISNHPWLGVGLNHFPAVMVEQGIPLEFRGFIFPVHNTFLLFLSEVGLPAGLLFIVFTITLVWGFRQQAFRDWISLGIWLGLVSFLVNAQFHTLFNQDPTFDFFMVLSAYLMGQYANQRTRHHHRGGHLSSSRATK